MRRSLVEVGLDSEERMMTRGLRLIQNEWSQGGEVN